MRTVCEYLLQGMGPSEIYRKFDKIPLGTIQNIKTGRQYADFTATIPGMPELIANRKKINMREYNDRIHWSNEQLHMIAKAIEGGVSSPEISKMLGYGEDPDDSIRKSITQIISGLVSGRVHREFKDQYDFSKSRKDLGFPNAGRYLPGKKHNESIKEVS